MKRLSLIVAACMVSGCATVPPSSRVDWEGIHVRQYDGATAREVQDAAEQVLRLADHDFSFQYPDGRLVASRNWMIYAVISITGGKDHWVIETTEIDGATRVTAMITRESATTTAAPVVGGTGIAPVTAGMPGAQITQAAPYQLFWERLEYMLGLRPEWTTCSQFRARLKETTRARDRGQLDALCGVTVDDMTPEIGPRRR